MGEEHLGANQGWVFVLCWNFLLGIKFYISKRIHSETRAEVLEAACLKKAESKASTIYDLMLSQSFV